MEFVSRDFELSLEAIPLEDAKESVSSVTSLVHQTRNEIKSCFVNVTDESDGVGGRSSKNFTGPGRSHRL